MEKTQKKIIIAKEQTILSGFMVGMASGLAAHAIGEPNSELISLSLESLVPAGAITAYNITEHCKNGKPSFAETAVVTGATIVGYVVTRVLYSQSFL